MASRTTSQALFMMLDFLVGSLMILSGVLGILPMHDVQGVIIAAYVVVFGVLILWSVFFGIPHSDLIFLKHAGGKGVFFIFAGCMIVGGDMFHLISGLVLIALGIVYIILHFKKDNGAEYTPVKG